MKKLVPLMLVACAALLFIGRHFGIATWMILVFGCLPIIAGGIGWLWWFRNVYFFRDPHRVPPAGDNLLLSPADGRVMYVYPVRGGEVTSDKQGRKIPISELARTEVSETRGWLVGIYMSPFDVHFNRAPLAGEIRTLHYHRTGVNLPMVDLWEYVNFTLFRKAVNMFAAPYHLENERMTMEIRRDGRPILFLILIADMFVNKITRHFEDGQTVAQGDKISFIQRGSQTDLFIPAENIEFTVKPGDHVKAGLSILGRFTG